MFEKKTHVFNVFIICELFSFSDFRDFSFLQPVEKVYYYIILCVQSDNNIQKCTRQ